MRVPSCLLAPHVAHDPGERALGALLADLGVGRDGLVDPQDVGELEARLAAAEPAHRRTRAASPR